MTDTDTAVARPGRPIRWSAVIDHAVLIAGSLLMIMPVFAVFLSTSVSDVDIYRDGLHLSLGPHMAENFDKALFTQGGFTGEITGAKMLMNSFILGIGFAIGKIIIGMMAAYAIVYFRLRFATFAFWMIFTTLLLPLEVRILPTYEVVASLGMLNSYAGLSIPLIASATATFLFRQFFMTVPDELTEAARVDGAGPMKFFRDILIPLSRTNLAALSVILFIYGWNQYLWPLLVTTDESYYTVVMGIQRMANAGEEQPLWNLIMATAILAMLPPVMVIIGMQRLFVRGLVETEK
ncbi:sn-glycerol-3-phosphate ABC transporter permease UgpE [uncultured Parasphingopyxis sp.]|uniref:sn-glycerol-3-phosphate ABC transporter permease UgpE n=1 Tax=uncultured Parasphingopyxis sp. TaxID=1547918 RepID=UPI00262064DA|nr:sn-glycerol-3-phosphate ABC transporter permease UgpE [uncultured Parasphingopyxis sp.]